MPGAALPLLLHTCKPSPELLTMKLLFRLLVLVGLAAVALAKAPPPDRPWIQCDARFYNKVNLTGDNFVLTTNKQYWMNTSPKFWAISDVGSKKLYRESNVWMDNNAWQFNKTIQSFELRCISSPEFKNRNLIALTVFSKTFKQYNKDPAAPFPRNRFVLENFSPEIAMTVRDQLSADWSKQISSAVITFNWASWYPGIRYKP